MRRVVAGGEVGCGGRYVSGEGGGRSKKLTRSFVPAAVLAPAEGAIAELAFVLLFWDERGLPGRSRGSRDGIQSGGRHDCDGILPFKTMVEYRLGTRAEACRLKCERFLLVYVCHSFFLSNHRFQ